MTHGKDDPHVYHRIILRPRPIKDPITGYTPDEEIQKKITIPMLERMMQINGIYSTKKFKEFGQCRV